MPQRKTFIILSIMWLMSELTSNFCPYNSCTLILHENHSWLAGEQIYGNGKFGESPLGEILIFGEREKDEGAWQEMYHHKRTWNCNFASCANGIQQNLICYQEIHFHFIGQTKSCYAQETSFRCMPNSNNSAQTCRHKWKNKPHKNTICAKHFLCISSDVWWAQ